MDWINCDISPLPRRLWKNYVIAEPARGLLNNLFLSRWFIVLKLTRFMKFFEIGQPWKLSDSFFFTPINYSSHTAHKPQGSVCVCFARGYFVRVQTRNPACMLNPRAQRQLFSLSLSLPFADCIIRGRNDRPTSIPAAATAAHASSSSPLNVGIAYTQTTGHYLGAKCAAFSLLSSGVLEIIFTQDRLCDKILSLFCSRLSSFSEESTLHACGVKFWFGRLVCLICFSAWSRKW